MVSRTEDTGVVLPEGLGSVRLPAGARPGDALRELPEAVRGAVVAARVNGRVVDLQTPLASGGPAELVTADSPDGLTVLRHSAAHLMAAAVLDLFPGAKFAIGPPIDEGFYYDIDIPRALTPEDLPKIEAKMRELAAERLPYQREEMPLEAALDLCRRLDQPYKVEILETIRRTGSSRPEADAAALAQETDAGPGTVSFYRTGNFLDLCRGPHVPDTSLLKAFKLTHTAGAYWRGDERNPMLQRIYGTAFPSVEALEAHLGRLEEAKRRDHRRLGRDLDLFSVSDEVGGGLILWHPKGGLVRKTIEDFWREEHLKAGYDLVYSPHLGRSALWQQSGHLDFYRENMYAPMEMEGAAYYVKPMNCPFHIMIYKAHVRSYRDLPLRLAELGTVYRFERAGVLHGLLRVRGFTQDDAHLFCTPAQMEEEVARAVRFSLFFLRTFGFEEYEAFIASRPDKFVGDPATWDSATDALRRAADRAGLKYEMDEKGGAFYGPKIDLKIKDTLGRPWQCTTVQFDFNMPDRFDITFVGEDNRHHRPFMVHRALLGSMERFLGVLIEHYAGAFPFWLAPEQVRVLPVADRHHGYAEEVRGALAGLRVHVDARSEKVGFKIREAELAKVPYILVVGDREATTRTVAVRARGGRDRGAMPVQDFLASVHPEEGPPT